MKHATPSKITGCCLLVGLLGCAGQVEPGDGGSARPPEGQLPTGIVLIPPVLADTGWLRELQEAQLETVDDFDVFLDFQFTDQIAESGITFQHRIVSDGGKTYKAVHYDHGNGVAVADGDGDGLYDL